MSSRKSKIYDPVDPNGKAMPWLWVVLLPFIDEPRLLAAMAKANETTKLSWPWWAPWALLAVAATSVLTVAATLYDIL